MTPEELKEFSKEFGKQTAEEIKKQVTDAEGRINEAAKHRDAHLITDKQFDELKTVELKAINDTLKKLEDAQKTQGLAIGEMLEASKAGKGKMKSMLQIFEENKEELKKIFKEGGRYIEIPLKAAALTSISNSVTAMTSPPTSPYAPGIGGPELTIYDILRNPAFVSNYVNMGETNQSRLAWINETSIQGGPALVAEGGLKPLSQHIYQVQFSQAKKIASYIQITEEFDVDLPGLSSDVQRLLGVDVLRAFDDQIQSDVINLGSTPFSFAGQMAAFQAKIYDATIWDALRAMGIQSRLANFIPNVSLINPVTYGIMDMEKDTVGRYNYPSDDFIRKVNPQDGNKLWPHFALVGDLKQFQVRVYKDFYLKMGWINDDFIKNQFCIVGEVRFHDFISDARKAGIVYGNAKWIGEQMNSTTSNLIGS